MPVTYAQAKKRERYSIKKPVFSKIGVGAESTVHKVTLKFKNGKKRKVVLKEMQRKRKISFKGPVNLLGKRERIINAKKAYAAFKRAALPVPSFFVPRLRYFSAPESILMENLTKRFGKIFPINPMKNNTDPIFLKKLLIKKDSVLIKDLAKDLATIFNLGFVPYAMDFWMFYKKGNSYDRVISDITLFTHKNDAIHSQTPKAFFKENMRDSVFAFKENMGQREFELFYGEFLENLKVK